MLSCIVTSLFQSILQLGQSKYKNKFLKPLPSTSPLKINPQKLKGDLSGVLDRTPNKFSKAILFGNNQEIQYSGKEEQEMVVGCQRLIQNAIVLWNELYLSQKIANIQDEEKRQTLLRIINHGSMLVWQHVNLHGEYDFTQDTEQLAPLFDLEKILALTIS